MSAHSGNDAAQPRDADLLVRVRRGEDAAAQVLVGRYRESIVRFCSRYLGTVHDAEDVAQETLAKLIGGRDAPTGPLRPWLYRVARNRCLDLLKQRRDGRAGDGSVVNDSRLPSSQTGPGTGLIREEQKQRITHAMALMPEALREVLVLRYFEDLRRKDIGVVLDLPDSIVKSRLYEARQKLKQLLADAESAS